MLIGGLELKGQHNPLNPILPPHSGVKALDVDPSESSSGWCHCSQMGTKVTHIYSFVVSELRFTLSTGLLQDCKAILDFGKLHDFRVPTVKQSEISIELLYSIIKTIYSSSYDILSIESLWPTAPLRRTMEARRSGDAFHTRSNST